MNRPAKVRLTVLSGSLVLFIASLEFYTSRQLSVAAIYAIGGLAGFSMLRNEKLTDKQTLFFSALIQAGLCLVQAWVLFILGKKGLPFAYLAAAAVGIVVLIRNRPVQTPEDPDNRGT